MKKPFMKTGSLAALAVALMLTGCSRHKTSSDAHDHSNHDHGTEESQVGDKADWCVEHNVPESQCGICRPGAVGALKHGESLQVRLPASNSAALAGVQTTVIGAGDVDEVVECYAELGFNQNQLAQIAPLVGGTIYGVTADLGEQVAADQVVARIWSASVAELVAKAVLTHQTLERERKLHADSVTSRKELQEAEAEHRAACQQLRTLGFAEEQIDDFSYKPQEKVLLEVTAPFAGEIVERMAVHGALIEAGKPLFTLANRTTMWAMLNIPETELARVVVGQPVELRVDSLPDRTFAGKLTWVSAEVDERTRMARARAEVANPDGALRSRMFARARILMRKTEGALLLPADAVQTVDDQSLVFVQQADDLFEARAVRLGAKSGGNLEIVSGVQAGESVAVTHTFALKSQLLISRLGAGCADD